MLLRSPDGLSLGVRCHIALPIHEMTEDTLERSLACGVSL
jgi:hypothetical protein